MQRLAQVPAPRRAVYWWTEAIAELRQDYVQTRCELTRDRREDEDVSGTGRLTRERVKPSAIYEAKGRACAEFMGSLERDLWGRPYKIVV